MRVLADQVQLGVELQREDAVGQLDQRAGGVARQAAVVRRPQGRHVHRARARRLGGAGVRERDLRDIAAGRAQRLGRLVGPELPGEAPAHGAVDRRRRVGDLGADPRRVVEPRADQAAQELAGGVLGGDEQRQAGAQVGLAPGQLDRRRLDLPSRPVLARLEVVGQDLAALAAEEARAGLLAQRAGLDQPAHDRRHDEPVALGVVGKRRVVVVGHVGGHVQADQVERAEGGAARPADQRPRELVDLVDPEAELLRESQRGHQAVDAEPVRDEGRPVLGDHRPLAEHARAVVLDPGDPPGVGRAQGDQLQQARVAGRVEEVGAHEGGAEGVGASLGQRGDRDAAGVGGDERPVADGAVGERLLEPVEQVALGLQPLDDGLDHPLRAARGLGQLVEAAGRDALRVGGPVDRGGAQLQRPLEAGARGVGVEVEQAHRRARARQQAGDLGAHRAGAEHRGGAQARDHPAPSRTRSPSR